MTATVPGHAPETFAWTIDCARIALGSGASCTMRGEPSIGPIEQSCLFAYDPGGKAVHFMCVTSMGEVHDHRGQWSGAAIEFEPLEATMNGEPIVESVSWRFPGPMRLETTSVVALRGGGAMRFAFAGTRQ